MRLAILLALLATAAAGQAAAQPADDMGGMVMPAAPPAAQTADAPASGAAPPPTPADHMADRLYDRAAMAAAREQLRREHGDVSWPEVRANLAEYQVRPDGGGYRWEGEASFGGDINRIVLRSEGEGARRGGVEAAEIQAVYSRAVSPYFNLQAGVRQDFRPAPERTYATVGFEGVTPYWIELSVALFLSTKGEVLGRLEGYEDFRLTQQLILQPRAEVNVSAQDIPARGIGAGVMNLELGLRLRYEISRRFAPYAGVSFDQTFGGTAAALRARGERTGTPSLVLGVRTLF